MKKIAIYFFLLILIISMVPAAVTAGPNDSSPNGGRIERALNLTDSQKSQLKPILKAARDQFIAVRTDQTLTPDVRRQKMLAIRAQLRAQVDQILTPQQQQQLDALRKNFRWHRQQSSQTPAQ